MIFDNVNTMFPLWKEREIRIVSTNDDDEGGPTGYEKPDLDCIIGASLVADLGASSVEWIIWFCRSWHHRRIDDSPLGLSQDICAVQMARQKTESKIGVPELSSNG